MFTKTGDKLVDEYAPSLVLVEFNMPYSVSGVTERNYHGTGVVLDPVRGLVAWTATRCPVALGDVRLTFAGTIQVDGTVEYVHPLHNLAVIRYDPRQLGETPVRAVKFADRMPATGETIHVVGSRRTTVWPRSRRWCLRSGRSASRSRARCSSATRTSRSCAW
jgi:hypothetical protein